jgi:hypothetical protein
MTRKTLKTRILENILDVCADDFCEIGPVTRGIRARQLTRVAGVEITPEEIEAALDAAGAQRLGIDPRCQRFPRPACYEQVRACTERVYTVTDDTRNIPRPYRVSAWTRAMAHLRVRWGVGNFAIPRKSTVMGWTHGAQATDYQGKSLDWPTWDPHKNLLLKAEDGIPYMVNYTRRQVIVTGATPRRIRLGEEGAVAVTGEVLLADGTLLRALLEIDELSSGELGGIGFMYPNPETRVNGSVHAITWSDSPDLEKVLRRDRDAIFPLHYRYTAPLRCQDHHVDPNTGWSL